MSLPDPEALSRLEEALKQTIDHQMECIEQRVSIRAAELREEACAYADNGDFDAKETMRKEMSQLEYRLKDFIRGEIDALRLDARMRRL